MDGRNHVLRHHEGLSAGRVIMQEPRTPWTPGRGRAHSDTAAARGGLAGRQTSDHIQRVRIGHRELSLGLGQAERQGLVYGPGMQLRGP